MFLISIVFFLDFAHLWRDHNKSKFATKSLQITVEMAYEIPIMTFFFYLLKAQCIWPSL